MKIKRISVHVVDTVATLDSSDRELRRTAVGQIAVALC